MTPSIHRYTLTLAVLLVTLPVTAAAGSNRVRTDQVQARLVSEVIEVTPYSGFWVGLRLEIKPGWHTYWSNPGDSGLATHIDWELPEGMVAGAIRWPVPHRFAIGDLMNYGYTDEVVLLTRMSVWPPAAADSPVTLAANASWLVCAQVCIPQGGRFELRLPAAAGAPAVDAEARTLLASYAGRLPVPARGQATFRATAEAIRLQVPLPPEWPRDPRDSWFFPERYGVVQHAAAQSVKLDADGPGMTLAMTLTRGELRHEPLERLRGVLVLRYGQDDERGISVDAEPD
jgi:thiol:disulfide interchange protein DsbD